MSSEYLTRNTNGSAPLYFTCRQVKPADYQAYRIPVVVKQSLPTDRMAAILDIGCGFGHFLRALRESGYETLTGVDISADAVAHCRTQGLPVFAIEDLRAFCRNAPRRYQFVMMSHVLEHIDKDSIIATLRDIREYLLADGGLLCVMVPNAQSATGCYWAYEDFTHTTLFTGGSLIHVLAAAGFGSVSFPDPEGLAGDPPVIRVIRRALLRLYAARCRFWNRVTGSSYHRPSPELYTFEILAIAKP